MTQEHLAFEAGSRFNSINKIENGKINPTLGTLLAVTDALKIDLLELLDF